MCAWDLVCAIFWPQDYSNEMFTRETCLNGPGCQPDPASQHGSGHHLAIHDRETLAMTARTRTPLAVHSQFAQLQATCNVHSSTVAPESQACPPSSAIDGCDGLILLCGRWQFGGGWALSGVRVHRLRTISVRCAHGILCVPSLGRRIIVMKCSLEKWERITKTHNHQEYYHKSRQNSRIIVILFDHLGPTFRLLQCSECGSPLRPLCVAQCDLLRS